MDENVAMNRSPCPSHLRRFALLTVSFAFGIGVAGPAAGAGTDARAAEVQINSV